MHTWLVIFIFVLNGCPMFLYLLEEVFLGANTVYILTSASYVHWLTPSNNSTCSILYEYAGIYRTSFQNCLPGSAPTTSQLKQLIQTLLTDVAVALIHVKISQMYNSLLLRWVCTHTKLLWYIITGLYSLTVVVVKVKTPPYNVLHIMTMLTICYYILALYVSEVLTIPEGLQYFSKTICFWINHVLFLVEFHEKVMNLL